jgi:hypothetical protein
VARETMTPVRAFALVAALIVAMAGRASAQQGTADGIAALARGDYARAVEILKPIAESADSRDAAAQFVMGGLYEAGHGVPADPLRACALYIRSGSALDNPFGRQAMRLVGRSFERGTTFAEECQALANVGFDHGFEPTVFHLGPSHSVELTLSAATVTCRGRATRTPMPFTMPGIRFRPARYTELATGTTGAVKRHFIEIVFWSPAKSGWELHWNLFEAVGAELVSVAPMEKLAIGEGNAPPATSALDPADYAVVRVDEEGSAEWAILKGDRRRRERIESEAERQEQRANALARDAALKAVDWTRRPDPSRRPTVQIADAEGCGNILVFGCATVKIEGTVHMTASASRLGG